MFITRVLSVILFLLSTTIQAVEYPVEVIEYLDNTKIVAFLNESDIKKTPQWTPLSSEPPLTIAGAIDAVQKHIKPVKDLSKMNLLGIELKQIPHHKNYWHYVVKTRTKSGDLPVSHYFVVLMNGKVIPAIKEPESVK
jgi:hypothetical protein